MAKGISQTELRQLAVVGARAKLQDLRTEIAELIAQFPELRGRGGSNGGNAAASGAAPASRRRRRRGRKGMSAEQRSAVSERMKKYWAERRKAKK